MNTHYSKVVNLFLCAIPWESSYWTQCVTTLQLLDAIINVFQRIFVKLLRPPQNCTMAHKLKPTKTAVSQN